MTAVPTTFLDTLARALADRRRESVLLEGASAAAVLVPLVLRHHEYALLFTERTHELPSHPGQISFPGGKVNAGDGGFAAAALREAHEEVGIVPANVRVIGMLDDVPTPSGFVITPVVGVIDPAPSVYAPNAAEVAHAFELSLATLRHPDTLHTRGDVKWRGRTYTMWEYHANQRRIWGATARMVHQLLEHCP